MRTRSRHEVIEASEPLLSVRDLAVTFGLRGQREVHAVDEVSFDVRPGQYVGLVGESGSGKSVTSLAIVGLLPKRGVRVTGEIRYDGRNLLECSSNEMNALRGRGIAMVFQDPMTSLNPVITVGKQLTEVIRKHEDADKIEAENRAEALLHKVGIPDPGRRLGEYPHQLSGGMRQRVLIAIALACSPKLLIADEPTTALDVTIQAQILALLKELVEDTGTALIMITHDLGVVAGLCDEVNVLYGGRIVERGERHRLFGHSAHPYTNGLLGSIPRLDAPRGERLTAIPGSVADNLPWASACAFAPRCPRVLDRCREETPVWEEHPATGLCCHNPAEMSHA